MIRINCIAGAICLLFLMTFCIGCFDTPYSLGPAGDAKVNRAYIGDFTQVTDKDKSTLIIRNIDDKQYYVEITSPGDKTPARFVGYTADVKGVTFAHLTMMQDDGGINAKHFIERIGISDDGTTLTLRSLNDKFFADKNIDSQPGQRGYVRRRSRHAHARPG
jgi:hypothetical protein